MPDYGRGKIYKICNTITDDIYIGATTLTLSERMQRHISASKDINKYKSKNKTSAICESFAFDYIINLFLS